MTFPQSAIGQTAASSTEISIPDDAAVTHLPLPGDLFLVRARKGQRETLIQELDLSRARVGGTPVAPIWSSPATVIEAYGLDQLIKETERILRETFGQAALVRPSIERDPESPTPSLVFWLAVPRSMRVLRHVFLGRYVRETVIPEGAPVPALLWEYVDVIPT